MNRKKQIIITGILLFPFLINAQDTLSTRVFFTNITPGKIIIEDKILLDQNGNYVNPDNSKFFRMGDIVVDTTNGNNWTRWIKDTSQKLTWLPIAYKWSNPQTAFLDGSKSTLDKYKPAYANKTFAQDGKNQAYIDTYYPGIGATVNDHIDWAAMMMARKEGTHVILTKSIYIGSKSIPRPTDKDWMIDGHLCAINLTASNMTLFENPVPTDLNNAFQTMHTFIVRNLVINGTGTQTVFRPMAMYGSAFINIHVKNVRTVFSLNFALKTIIDGCMVSNVDTFVKFDIMPNWGTTSNSQCNHSGIWRSRAYNTNIFCNAIAMSGLSLDQNIHEGNYGKKTLVFDAKNSSVVKDGGIRNTHSEITSGFDCLVELKNFNGTFTIEKSYAQYPGYVCKASGTTAYPLIVVKHIPWWVKVNGKAFYNSGYTWQFELNEAFNDKNAIPSLFDGIQPQHCSGSGCGSNKFGFVPIPR